MMNFKHAIAIAMLAVLAACSGGGEKAGGQSQAVIDTFKARKESRAAKAATNTTPVITRAVLDQISISMLEAKVENNKSTAYLTQLAARNDRALGKLVVWASSSSEQVILRNGVLVGTKGIGNDLASVEAHATVKAVKARAPGGGQKTLYIRRDDFSEGQMQLQCEIVKVADETIEIVERRFATTHLRENCSNSSGQFVNDFWVDRRDSSVIKSRQWGGPKLGYLSFRLLNK